MKQVHEDISIKLSVVKKLPTAFTIMGVYDGVSDMNGKEHRALKLFSGQRASYFSVETGEYLGDSF